MIKISVFIALFGAALAAPGAPIAYSSYAAPAVSITFKTWQLKTGLAQMKNFI